MRRDFTKKIKLFIILSVIVAMSSNTVMAAAFWATPGYQWAVNKRITSLANNSALSNKVSHANFYSVLIKYLKLKNVPTTRKPKQNVSRNGVYNKTIDGIIATVDEYISKDHLTSQGYKTVATYIEHVDDILKKNSNFLDRDDLKNVYLYMSLAKYKAATMINEPGFKSLVLAGKCPTKEFNVNNVAYKEIVDYSIKPYYGDITRKDFLVLMFSLLSEQNLSEEEIIKQFYESSVLQGDGNGELWLNECLTYEEMFTFLYRFEMFEFNPTEESLEDIETEKT